MTRRMWFLHRWLLVLVLVFPLAGGCWRGSGSGDAGEAGPPAASLVSVELVGMTVSDLDQAIDFYTRVLTFDLVAQQEISGPAYQALTGVSGIRLRVAQLRLGSETLELTEYLTRRGRPIPADSRSNDRWFQHVAIIVSDMDSAYQVLRHHKVRHLSIGPQRLPDSNPAAGGIRAFYFADPDGHPLEILQFPKDKGDPRWHRPVNRLFLGIDHTAIVVRDTEASLRFYRDILGLTVAGESWNSGPEQERLNNVPGARLRITGLRGASGPGIEFLEYLSPRDGRELSFTPEPNDLVYWQTRIAGNLPQIAGILQREDAPTLSPGIVSIPVSDVESPASLLVRDPDGHVVQLVDR